MLYTLPGPVVEGSKVSLSQMTWRNWGAARATATGKLQRGARRVTVTITGDRRLEGGVDAEFFYSRLTLKDSRGRTQRIGMDAQQELS